ncbi:hypothetical protein PV327_006116 [Microctonus hyperodae]|uniref:ATPase AAA-type core domain-containing protein n=1 Tax=Microctonus hyperodae TaxID=165561 RepID=A0AA39G335_MICHY|nr:hypothetical protein PV327_006116 [Microctonus hyperodae]
MSNITYNELWHDAECALEEVIQTDSILQNIKPQRDRRKVHNNISDLYVRYIVICNKLEKCYDQMIQPQKRRLIRKLLDYTLARVLELKHELVEVDLSEYNYYDDVLIKYGILPQEVELNIPSYFRRERESEIQLRREFITSILKNIGALNEVISPKKMTELDAIKLIQMHERARQGRVRFQFMKEIREMKEKSTIKPDSMQVDIVKEIAATLKIQKVWRGYITRQKMRKKRFEEMLLIGMIQPAQIITENYRIADKVKQDRHLKQLEFQKLYEKMILETQEFLKLEKTTIMEENMRCEIRCWINEYFQQTGKIPELPSAESGGSRLIISRQGTESSLSKSKESSSSKESKRSKKSKSKKESDTEKSEDESDPGIKIILSNALPELIQAHTEYQDIWRSKDECANPWQLPYSDIILAQKTRELEDEVRFKVDQTLRDDIEALQLAVDRDKGHKGKRAKKTPKRVRRSGKKNKRKKEKDLTPDRTIDSLIEELTTEGIIKLFPEIYLSNFKGEKSFVNYELWQNKRDPIPTIGDVRQLVAEYCILPLGNDDLRQLTPLVRSVLIAGSRDSGKKMLVHAICTELGATFFDISPSNIAGKYPGKSGLIMLLHLIGKVSRLLQPSVIFMDDAEKPFVKKVPKTDKSDPKRLKKDLPKLIKSLTNEDRVIIIGTSHSPWDCDQKLLYQTYDKVIYIPRPDYGTMSMLWKDLLYKYSGINRQFDTSAMAKICDGFTVGTVIRTIDEVIFIMIIAINLLCYLQFSIF